MGEVNLPEGGPLATTQHSKKVKKYKIILNPDVVDVHTS